MKRMFEYLNHKIKENDKSLKKFVGKDMIIMNGYLTNLYFIEDAELEELQELEPGLIITLVMEPKKKGE